MLNASISKVIPKTNYGHGLHPLHGERYKTR